MASLNDILAGFKARLETIPGLRSSLDGGEPESVNPPQAWAEWRGREPATLDASSQTMTFAVIVIVKPGTIRTARAELFEYLSDTGDHSIEQALNGDDTLGGAIDGILKVSVDEREGWGSYTIGGVSYPAGTLRVEVIA